MNRAQGAKHCSHRKHSTSALAHIEDGGVSLVTFSEQPKRFQDLMLSLLKCVCGVFGVWQ